jgi:hypothetical protein
VTLSDYKSIYRAPPSSVIVDFKFLRNSNAVIFSDRLVYIDKQSDVELQTVDFGDDRFDNFSIFRDMIFAAGKTSVSVFHPKRSVQRVVSVREPGTFVISVMIDRVFLLSSRVHKSGKQSVKVV